MKFKLFAFLIAFSILSCGSDDDSQQNTGSFENDIIGNWMVSDVEITDSSLNGIEQGTEFVFELSAEIINPENNTSISSYSSNPNLVIDNGGVDIRITSNIEFSSMGEVFGTTDFTEERIEGFGEISTWEIDNNIITFTLNDSDEVVIGQIIELNENTLAISTPLEDFVEDSDFEDAMGDVGNLVITYSRINN